jgi:hypothetical protein
VRQTIAGARAHSWTVDYSAARARAIEWLGARHLLAQPINVRAQAWRKVSRAPTSLRLAPAAANPGRGPG